MEKKVPLLGDIPVLGWLFKVQKSSSTKKNLFFFLTPHVVNSPEEAQDLYGGKKRRIEGIKEGQIKMYDDKKQKMPEAIEN